MNIEKINKNVNISIRSIEDATTEELYLFHYINDYKDFKIPFKISIERVNYDILKFITKNKSFKLLSSFVFHRFQAKKHDNFNLFENVENDSFLFEYSGKNKYPILVKLLFKDNGYFFNACSFSSDELDNFINTIIKKFALKPDYDAKIYFGIIYAEGNEVSIRKIPFDVGVVKDLNLNNNYGEGFGFHHEKIVSSLENFKNGILIFNGIRGSGKSTYIKYLAKLFAEKRMFVFIPTNYLNELVSPSLIPILLENKDSVLVLEDAEKAVVSRERGEGNESMVSTLLNIGDGILGSMLNLTVILTFNTDIENIDSSISRKGRLLYQHTFDKLNINDAQNLSNKLGNEDIINESMSLADIYGLKKSNNFKEPSKEGKKIGFFQ